MNYGLRELVYFLSRFPRAKDLGGWEYDPRTDSWRGPTPWAIKVSMEASESISACVHSGGLTPQEISVFVERNSRQEARGDELP